MTSIGNLSKLQVVKSHRGRNKDPPATHSNMRKTERERPLAFISKVDMHFNKIKKSIDMMKGVRFNKRKDKNAKWIQVIQCDNH